MKSIDLTHSNGETVTIFIEKISYIRTYPNGSAIGIGSNEVKVKEKRTEVIDKLKSPSQFFVL